MSQAIAFIVIGIGAGSLYSLGSLGLVAVYRATGVINFASGAIGMVGAFVYWELAEHGQSLWIALVLGTAVSMFLGLAVYFVAMRPLVFASQTVKLVAVLAVMIIIQAAATLIFPVEAQIVQPILPQGLLHITGYLSIGEDRAIMVGTVLAAALLMAWIYNRTKFGLATAAMSENPSTASALGISPNGIAALNWALAGALSGVAGILLAPITDLQISAATILVIPFLAAALVGGLRSFPLAVAGGIGIGVIQSVLTKYVPTPGLPDSVPFLIIILLLAMKGRVIQERGGTIHRVVPVGTGKIRVVPLAMLVAAYVVLAYFLLSPTWVSAFTVTFATGILILSVVVITGYAGQLSLAQAAVGGIGAAVAAQVASAFDLPFEVVLAAGVIAAVPVALLVGLPAVRTRGVQLAVITAGLAVAINSLIFSTGYLVGGATGLIVPTPVLFGINLNPITHPDAYSCVVLACFVLAGVVVANVRRGRLGRSFLAIRENERSASALGISVPQVKLLAFCLGGAIAGLGGVLTAFQNPDITFASGYDVFESINVVLYSVIGGLGHIPGPLIGGLLQPGSVINVLLSNVFGSESASWIAVAGGLITLRILAAAPGGVFGLHVGQLKALIRLTRRGRQSDLGPTAKELVVADIKVKKVPLILDGVRVEFGGVRALDDFSLTLHPGEVVGLIGPNGAGKTTLIDAVTGFVAPTKGEMRLGGRQIERLTPAARARIGLGRSFQDLGLFSGMSVLENLRAASDRRDLLGYVSCLLRPDRVVLTPTTVMAIRQFNLSGDLQKLPADLPFGVRRLVAIARTLAAAPSILLLDEPSAGLDDTETRELGRLIRQLADEWGIAILLVEHDVHLVLERCDRVVALNRGQIIAIGTPEEVRVNPAVVDAYLGTEAPAGKSVRSDESAG